MMVAYGFFNEDISKSKNYNGIISVEFSLNLKEIRSSNGTNQ